MGWADAVGGGEDGDAEEAIRHIQHPPRRLPSPPPSHSHAPARLARLRRSSVSGPASRFHSPGSRRQVEGGGGPGVRGRPRQPGCRSTPSTSRTPAPTHTCPERLRELRGETTRRKAVAEVKP
eukprot:337929-Rhodomonas_salina.1